MSLRGLVQRFKTGTYTVTRSAVGVYINGRYTQVGGGGGYLGLVIGRYLGSYLGASSGGGATAFPIDACIYPATGRDLKVLPEGQHAEEVKVVVTETELRTRTPQNGPDSILIDGDNWTVATCSRWDQGASFKYYRALVARQAVP